MAKEQTRRSISIRFDLYSRLKVWCEANNRSMSSVVEEAIGQQLRFQTPGTRPIERNGNVFTF